MAPPHERGGPRAAESRPINHDRRPAAQPNDTLIVHGRDDHHRQSAIDELCRLLGCTCWRCAPLPFEEALGPLPPGTDVSRAGALVRWKAGGRLVSLFEERSVDVDAAPGLLAGLRNGKWLDQQHFPPLAYALPGILPEGSALLVGPPKIGKSWLVLTLALATASGGKALGIDVPARPTLYMALEDGHRRLQDRCRKLLRGQPIPHKFDYLIRLEQGRVVDTIAEWLERQAGEAPLVILDTLGKVMPPAMPGESAYGRDYRIGGILHHLCEEHPGLTLLVNHHDRKAGSDDFVDSVSGTHGLAGAADTILVLQRDRSETTGLLKVTGREIPEGEYALQLQDGYSWRLDGDDLPAAAKRARKVRATTRATANLGDRTIDVILYVHKHPKGVRAAEVAEALKLEPKQAQVYLARALKAGRLERPERGLYLPVGSVGSVGSAGQSAEQTNTSNTAVGSQTSRVTSQSNTPNTSNTPRGGGEAA